MNDILDDTIPPPGDPEDRMPGAPADEGELIIVPARNVVLFPGMVFPLSMSRPQSIAAAQEAARTERLIGVVMQRDPAVEAPGAEDLHEVGTTARIMRYVTAQDGTHHVVCRGERRFRITEYRAGEIYPTARVAEHDESEVTTPEMEARVHRLKALAHEAMDLLRNAPGEASALIDSFGAASTLADFVAGLIDIEPSEKQEVLETFDVGERIDKVLSLLGERIHVLRLSRKIGEQTEESLGAQQREHILREQLRQIQKELGEEDDKAVEIAELRESIEKAQMSEEAEQQANKELKRLERMHEAAAEYAMIRAYLDWLIELPWSVTSGEVVDIAEARRILDEDHYGLDKIKLRILEYLAVHKLNPRGRSPILCFVGPPGVGKTSLGQSIARATGRKFVRISLGGVHDEAEIRGHRRTYIGALPGNIIQGFRKAGTNDPVFMLDEMDKLGSGFQGDPSAGLLEVLDPEQNGTFRDNYLAVQFDLSHAMFISTANVLDGIPGPLRDRMEVIELPGYTEDEKTQIAMRYLVGRQIAANGLTTEQFGIGEDAVRAIVREYTREAGCRNLEREIGKICRHVAMRVAEGEAGRVEIGAGDLTPILGPIRFENEAAMRTSVPGVATGLAWTPAGGDILFIEAARVPGNGKLILTGQLGDVMKESAQAALSLVKGGASKFGFQSDLFEKSDIHIHVPAGAIPKDGPSAGVAIYMALVSLLTGRTVRSDTAMTGEISLRGLVLPIGGIKEKVLAAVRAGIEIVLLPARNRKDLEDVPASAREKIRFVWLSHVSDAIDAALSTEAGQLDKSASSSELP
jgi:ATP-dependent Lon protease